MTHLNNVFLSPPRAAIEYGTLATEICQPTVVVVSENPDVASVLDNISEFLGFDIELVGPEDDIVPVLRALRPMAVVTEMDAGGQDGCHVMMMVADHDPALPMLVLTGDDPAMAGAIDAVEELWHLTAVTQSARLPAVGPLVEFLFQAGRRGNCIRLMPT